MWLSLLHFTWTYDWQISHWAAESFVINVYIANFAGVDSILVTLLEIHINVNTDKKIYGKTVLFIHLAFLSFLLFASYYLAILCVEKSIK